MDWLPITLGGLGALLIIVLWLRRSSSHSLHIEVDWHRTDRLGKNGIHIRDTESKSEEMHEMQSEETED